MITKVRNKPYLLTLLLLALLIQSFSGLLQPQKARAADIDSLPYYLNNTYDQYISRNPDVAGKGNYTPSFRFILYSPTSGPSGEVRITRGGLPPNQLTPPRCENFTFSSARLTADNASSGRTSTDAPVAINSCTNTPYGFRLAGIGANRYGTSDRFSNYSGTVIRLLLNGDPQGDSTFTDIQTIDSSPDAVTPGADRLSYVGDNSPPSQIPDSANGVSMSLPENSGNTIISQFAPPCNYNGERAYVWWKDADSRQDTNGGSSSPVNFEVREFVNGYSNGYQTIDSGDAGGVGSQHYRSSFIPKDGAKYEIRFTGVRARSASHAANTIKVWAPFDSAAASVQCPGPPPPTVCKGNWTYNTGSNSWYRFRMFDRTPNINYPSDQIRTDAEGRGSWATVSGANELYDSNGLQNPSDRNINLPNEIQYLGGFVLIERWWHHDTNGNGTIDWDYNHGSETLPMCATASCSVRISPVDKIAGSNDGVRAGQNFNIQVNFAGSNAPGYLASQPLAVIVDSADWGGGVYNFGHGIGTSSFPSTSGTKSDITLTMPFDTIPRNLHVYIGYPNLYHGRIDGLGCGTPINPYHQFNITPNAFEPVMDDEDPRTISYTAGGNNTGAAVTLGWERQLLRKRGGVESTLDGVHTGASTFGNFNDPVRTFNPAGTPLVPGTLLAGDQVCSRAYFPITDGWVGPGNHIADGSAKSPPANPKESTCITISDKPYLRLYGADAIAGSEFAVGDVCNNTNSSEIKTFFSNHADRSGSGAQFAALAMGLITQFSSASLRASTPIPMNGLSFANTGSPGFYDGANICAGDFYSETQYDDPAMKDTRSSSTLPLASLNNPPNDNKQTLAQPGGSPSRVTLNGTSGFDNKHTIFVDGDLNIDSNVEYSAFTDPTDAPALAIIVRGDIYINKNVTRLDGMYVAQKKADGSGGTIYTCSDGFNAYSSAQDAALIANCSSQLVVNGAFVANYVRFLRTINSLRDSRINDQELAGITKAAEVFNFTPEMYLSQPPFKEECAQCRYKSFETLPPIL